MKLPIEAAAVLLVAVSALYLYQRAPEVQHLARQESRESPPVSGVVPAPPAAPPGAGAAGDVSRFRDQASETKRAPAAQGAAREEARTAPPVPARPATPAPAPPIAPGGDAREAPPAKSEAAPAARPELSRQLMLEKEAQVERRPDAGSTAGTPSPTGKVAQSAEPSSSRDAAGARAATTPPPAETAAPAAAPAPPPEARGRVGGVASAPPAVPTPEGATGGALASAKARASARVMRAVDASGRLVVPAREPAEAALDALLRRLGATPVARRLEGPHQTLVLIDVVVPRARYRELVEGLGGIGRWTPEHELELLPAEVRVEVALTVEP